MSARFTIEDGVSALALGTALAVSRTSRVWSQRGLGTAFKWLGRVPGFSTARCRAEFVEGCFFETEVFEPYWGPTVVGGRGYEPEMLAVFRWVSDLRPILVDCGANFGFWSVLGTGPEIGFPLAIAIEAHPTTFRALERNAHLNDDRFRCLHRAVDEVSGRTVHLGTAGSHVTAHIETSTAGPAVETITIDDAVADASIALEAPLLIKLDVENHELPALRGSTAARRSREHLLSVEDFRDNDHFAHVRFLLDESYAVFFVDAETGPARAFSVPDVQTAGKVASRTKGNAKNFFATPTGSRFAERLRSKILPA